MCKVPIQALHEIVYDPKHDRNIRRVIATSIERHESQVSRLLSDQCTLDQNQAARLGRDLTDKLGEMRWSRCFVGTTHMILPKPAGYANGHWEDDAAKFMKFGGDWCEAMEYGDKEAAQKALDRIRSEVLADMQAETERL